MIKARVGELQAKEILPIQAAAYCICRLAISEVFQKLQNDHQRQAPGSGGGLTMRGKQISKLFIRVNGAKGVTQLDHDISSRKRCMSDTSRFFRYGWNGMGFERHGWPPRRQTTNSFSSPC